MIEKVKDNLSRNNQVLFFVNRRGYSPFVLCKNCLKTFDCPFCSINLVYHKIRNNLTTLDSSELNKQYDIICDLIKAKNDLANTINENTNEITDSLNRIEGMIDAPKPRRRRK